MVKKGKQGEGGGRPPKYSTESSLKDKIFGYFELADSRKKIYSKAGLLGFLNISRPTWMEYKKKFPNTTRIAEYTIEEVWIDRLTSPGATGAIFYLKNAFKEDYKDRNETDVTTGGEKIISITYIKPDGTKDRTDN